MLALLLLAAPVRAAQLVSLDDALRASFPGATFARGNVFLTGDQLAAVEKAAGTRPTSKIVTRVVASEGGTVRGYAYVDTHLVRTMQETVLIVLDAAPADSAHVVRIEVLAFNEPREYLPGARWFAQFDGKGEGPDLAAGRGIRTLAGATLSSRAVTDAVRRVLALHRILGAAAKP